MNRKVLYEANFRQRSITFSGTLFPALLPSDRPAFRVRTTAFLESGFSSPLPSLTSDLMVQNASFSTESSRHLGLLCYVFIVEKVVILR